MYDDSALKVTVIGTGDGTSTPTHGSIAKTPGASPNLVTIIVSPIVALAVRFGHSYGAALVGLLVAIPTTGTVPFSDFWDLLVKSSTLALAGPVLGLLKDIVTIFARLETKYPLMSGSV